MELCQKSQRLPREGILAARGVDELLGSLFERAFGSELRSLRAARAATPSAGVGLRRTCARTGSRHFPCGS